MKYNSQFKDMDMGIRGMAYSNICSGTVSLDRSNTALDSSYDHSVPIVLAVAQKFKPTSKCLSNVTVMLKKYFDNDVYLEIRKTSIIGDKLPDGNPQGSSGRIAYVTIPYTSIPVAPGEVSVTLNAVLDDFDMANGVWIVICAYAYDPQCTADPCFDPSFDIKGAGPATIADQYIARKNKTNPWVKFNDNIYFKTFKQSISCATPLCNFELTS